MTNYSKNVLYYGEEKFLARSEPIRIGALSFEFDPEAADLRFIKFGEYEILRRLYAAVRDFNWGTIPQRVSNLKLDVTATTFRITFQVEHQANDIDFVWQGTISGTEAQLIFSLRMYLSVILMGRRYFTGSASILKGGRLTLL